MDIIIRGANSLTPESNAALRIDGFPIGGLFERRHQLGKHRLDNGLKDASAAAVYGPRGASGVIIIMRRKRAWRANPRHHTYSIRIPDRDQKDGYDGCLRLRHLPTCKLERQPSGVDTLTSTVPTARSGTTSAWGRCRLAG